MFLTTRLRDAGARGDKGAVAIIVAITSLVLFGVAALAIDIGDMYSRRRAAQTDADLAALAGAAGLPDQTTARNLAYQYLAENLPHGGPIGAITAYADGNLNNGEILFPTSTKIRVVIPARKVDFGFAGVLGFSSANVNAAATAEVRSPAAALPYFVTLAGASGYSCLKDGSGGGNSAMRAVLFAEPGATRPPAIQNAVPGTVASPLLTTGGETMVISGDNFKNPAPDVTSVKVDNVAIPAAQWTINSKSQITVTNMPLHAAGTGTLVLTNADGPSNNWTLNYAAPTPPTISSTSPATLSTAGGTTLTITGAHFQTPAATTVTIGGTSWPFSVVSDTSISVPNTPAKAAGPQALAVTNPHGTGTSSVTYVAPPVPPKPVVTSITPTSGTVGTTVVITGSNFSNATGVTFGSTAAVATITNGTTIQTTAPAGTGAVHVHVTNPGGASNESAADVFTYEVDSCVGSTGSYGYLDVGRTKPPTNNGANDLVMINSIVGIDHGWTSFPSGQMPAIGTECQHGNTLIPGAILDSGNGVEGSNCVNIQNGNKTNDVATAFLDGFTKSNPDLDPRLTPPDSDHDTGTVHGRSNLDRDHINKYLTVPLIDFTNALANGTSTPGWLKPEIVECPRFAIVPILNVAQNPANGYYPIKGFAGVFIDSPATEYGFEPNNNGNQMKTIKAYAFPLDFLPGIISAGTTEGTVTYIGAGPKVPVLVHDSGDPSY